MQLQKFRPIIAIDPGTTHSGVVVFDGADILFVDSSMPNKEVLIELNHRYEAVAIEMIESYGMPVGKSTFETVLWVGRFIEKWSGRRYLLYRKDIKLFLCGTTRAKDANIRQALLDLFPQTGGGKTPAVGTSKQPGPLHGVKSHAWSALAVAVTYFYGEDARKEEW